MWLCLDLFGPYCCFFLLYILCSSDPVVNADEDTKVKPSSRIHIFYYTWYGEPNTDGKWMHWNHTLLKMNGANDGPTPYHPPDHVAAAYYPKLGAYSSGDPIVIQQHLKWMQDMRVGVVAVSWWGRQGGDGQMEGTDPSFTDRALTVLFNEAEKTDIQLCLHLEPYPNRTPSSTVEDLKYLFGKYGKSSALYKVKNKEGKRVPLVYIYDSYHNTATEWADVLSPNAENTIRNTELDIFAMSLLVERHHLDDLIIPGHFDGFYTYFGTDGFSYGSSVHNWGTLQGLAQRNKLAFCPCVGSGYDDHALRPWNSRNTRERHNGEYYDYMWKSTMPLQPDFIGITSFNEWGEGTQIEPAIPKETPPYSGAAPYLDYSPHSAEYYLQLTNKWVSKWVSKWAVLNQHVEEEL